MNLEDFKIPTLKERYTKLIADRLTISLEDLTESEKAVIDESFELFEEKMDDLKIANDEVKRLTIELANHKAMNEDNFKVRRKDDFDDNTFDSHDLNYK
jgi:hypothetical protein